MLLNVLQCPRQPWEKELTGPQYQSAADQKHCFQSMSCSRLFLKIRGEEAGKALSIYIFKNTHIAAALSRSQPRNSMRGSALHVEIEFLDSKPVSDYPLNDFS